MDYIYIASSYLFALFTLFGLPGPLMVFMVTGLYVLIEGATKVTIPTLIIMGVIALFGSLVDSVFMLMGAKNFGATRYGIAGAFIGLVLLTVVFGPIGVILGPLVGAFVGEFLFGQKKHKHATKAAIGAVIGLFTGVVAKFVVALGMAIWLSFLLL